MDEFPPNRKIDTPKDQKKVERIVSGEAVRRKKPLSKQLTETFIGGDPKSTFNYIIMDVLIPAARDALVDAGSQGFEKLIFGDTRGPRRRQSSPSAAMGIGQMAYNRMRNPTPPDPRPALSRRARATHDFDEIVLSSRSEADQVIDRLFDLVDRFGFATVGDLYDLVGIDSTHTDQKWGWTDMRGSGVTRLRNQGFLLDLPEAEEID